MREMAESRMSALEFRLGQTWFPSQAGVKLSMSKWMMFQERPTDSAEEPEKRSLRTE
jgi:hypothetical protein